VNGLSALLQDLPSMSFGFILVIARVGTAMLTGPALGEYEIPTTVRVALAAILAGLVYPTLQDVLPHLPREMAELVGLIVMEIIVGAWLGFMTRVMVMALAMTGGVISLMVGLSSVLQIDPSVGAQVTALQRMLSIAAVSLLFASGLYILPIQAIVGSYDVIVPGSAFNVGGAAEMVVRAVSGSFGLSIRLAAPFVITCLVWQAVLGFVSRLIPNIQVHVVSAPAQILGGLALLAAAVSLMLDTWSAGMRQAFSILPGL
jgi:flagellar biosynthetic protein FliR